MGKKKSSFGRARDLVIYATVLGSLMFLPVDNNKPNNAENKQRASQSLEERIDASKNLGRAVLSFEQQETGIVKPEHYILLDRIIEEAKDRINIKSNYTEAEAFEILKTIDDMLKNTFNFRIAINKENFLFSHSLRDRRLDCNTASLIYLSIAQSLGLPLSGVNAPRHMFVRLRY
ncbi:hypothetical protein J4206_02960, partial [Candidatus Woesearchaeota archaeon]|nr:hypothetical protein [Candidatus Woesearchaeota archaeon]